MKGAHPEIKSTTFVFLSLEGNRFSRTINYRNGLEKMGFELFWFEIDPQKKNSQIGDIVRKFESLDVIYVVASPSHILVPYLRIKTRRKVVLDAGWPLYDGVIQSRRKFGFLGWRLLWTFLLDFLTFHLASKVFLETNSQIDVCSRRYFLLKRKMYCLATGFDENRVTEFVSSKSDSKKALAPIVLFRGGPQEEAGLNVLFDAIKYVTESTEVRFIVVSKVQISQRWQHQQLEVINDFQQDDVLWDLYRKADIVLGQLSNHARLDKTLPHKFFEAGFFEKAYVSSDRGVIRQYIHTNEVAGFRAGDPRDLARVIDNLLSSQNQIRQFSDSVSALYRRDFAQDVLTKKFLEFSNS